MSKTKKSLFLSALSMLLCVLMLVGTTYAWFTDKASTGIDHIISGNLDVEMYWKESLTGDSWHNVEDPAYSAIFGDDLWEPGYTVFRYVKIVNAGNLALKYVLNMLANGTVGKLADVIDVYYLGNVSADPTRAELAAMTPSGTLAETLGETPVIEGTLAAGEEDVFGVALKMRESAGNEYQNLSVGDSFSVIVRATQWTKEFDSIGDRYDEDAAFPEIVFEKSAPVTVNGGVTAAAVTLGGAEGDNAKAEIPAGVKVEEGTERVTFTVKTMKESGANLVLPEELAKTSVDVHVEGVAEGNTAPIIVTLENYAKKNLNSTSVTLYHVENGVTVEMTRVSSEEALTAHNTFTYDPETGTVKMALCSFSEILVTVNNSDPWTGNTGTMPAEEDGVYTINTAEQLAAFAASVNGGNDYQGKTVKLGKNIILNDWTVGGTTYTAKELAKNNTPAFNNNGAFHKFTPIGVGSNLSSETGANNDLKPFRGTFDGCGYAVSGLFNLYSTDPAEYSAQIGLFGCVENATVKNLTVRDSFIYTYGGMVGFVSSFAGGTSTFENITLEDNFGTAYNNYLGGVVGCVFDHDGTNANVTFRNCCVDSSNLFEALWGTYDAPVGGLVGGAYANSDVTFTDCIVWPEMSLYNDCCANYQWFAYRYSGMLIGYVRASDRASYLANKVHCTNVIVKYGEWTDQYYCELVSAGKGSYNAPDEYKYVRINKNQVLFDENGTVIGCDETLTHHSHDDHPEEDHVAVNIAFNQLFGGGQGVYGEKEHAGVTVIEDVASISIKLPNTDSYLYRIGNRNAVALGSLFKAEGGTNIYASAVKLTAYSVVGMTHCEYTANSSDWTKGTIGFNNTETGVIKLVLDYLNQEPIELYLEVVDAVNATTATSATANNVVLLNDVSGSSVDVSNGYVLFGNGFKMTFIGNGSRNAAAGYSEGFVNVTNGGVLDNVQVVCKVFPKGYLYATSGTERIMEPGNVVSPTDTTHYKYQWSAVALSGEGSTISNSYIYGARNNVYIGNGNVTIDNCVLECGALANIQIQSNDQGVVNLKNLTTVQYLVNDGFGEEMNVLGGAILLGSGDSDAMASETNPTINVEGTFNQYNWVNNTDKTQVGSTAQTILNLALGQTKYIHDGCVNMGIVCMNTNPLNVYGLPEGYEKNNVTSIGITGQVYSLTGENITPDRTYTSSNPYPYLPNTQGTVPPTLSYSGTSENVTFTKSAANCTVTAELAAGGNFAFDFDNLTVAHGGTACAYTVKDANGNPVDKSAPVVLNTVGTTVYTLTADCGAGYNPDGTVKAGSRAYEVKLTVAITMTEIPAPVFTAEPSGTPIYVGTTKGSDWSIAVPVLDGAEVQYWSTVKNELVTLDLSEITADKTTNNSLTISGPDYTLELTSTAIKSSKTNMWVAAGGKLYVTISATSDYVSTNTTSRSTTVTYKFTADSKNDAPVSTTKAFSADKPGSDDTTYKYSDLTNGTLTALTSGGGGSCIANGTLITIADGRQVPVETLTGDEMLLAWDLENGCFTQAPIVFVDSDPEGTYEVIDLIFSDGTDVEVITEHGFFDIASGEYVYVDAENCGEYLGHEFVKQSADGWTTVTLTNVVIEEKTVTPYSPVTAGHLCYYVNGMLSMPGGIDGLFNIFAVDSETMTYDAEAMASDIEAYGLFTYEDFAELIPEEMFTVFNGQYLKVAMAKGMITWEDIAYLAERYTPLATAN